MSPDRLVKTIDGFLGGALVIFGAIYLTFGLSWISTDSSSRDAGIEWSPYPWITEDVLGALWLVSGVLAVGAGFVSKAHRGLELTAYALALFTPAAVATVFMCAWWVGAYENGPTAAIVYGGYAPVLAWIGSRTKGKRVTVITEDSPR